MKKLCFGTLFAILYQIKNKGINQGKLYHDLIEPNDDSGIIPDKGSVGRKKKGIDDISGSDKLSLKNFPLNELAYKYRKKLDKDLDNNLKKPAILCIKDILYFDSSIDENEELGDIAYTKKVILESVVFDFFSLLASLIKYISGIQNDIYGNYVSEVPDDYVNSMIPESNKIKLENSIFKVNTKLDFTIKEADFKQIFTEINPNTYSLDLLNPSRLKIYRLNVSNKGFDTCGLVHFIYTNIGRYVFSRTKRKDFKDKEEVELIASEAIKELIKSSKYISTTENFGGIMLYSFLECVLHAPKIMSNIESCNSRNNEYISSGIYLLPAGALSNNNQIVFGCSKINDSITSAIDDVFKQAVNIKENIGNEMRILDSSNLNQIIPNESTNYIKELILPTREKKSNTDNSFGIFLSYSISVPNKGALSNFNYLEKLEEKMDEDIKKTIPYIKEQLQICGLSNYSVYFFVMPLDNISNDSETIMKKIIGDN